VCDTRAPTHISVSIYPQNAPETSIAIDLIGQNRNITTADSLYVIIIPTLAGHRFRVPNSVILVILMSPISFDFHPEVSVIVCTFNRANYLPKCIDSVINQTFKNWELLIVDDGSNDNSFDIVNSYLDKHHNIRYLKHGNRKQAYSKNAGIQASFGQYLTFLDSDDSYLPEHIESRLSYLKTNPDLDLIQGAFYSEEEIIVVDYYQPDRTINLRDCALGPTFFGKRKVFFELQGFKHIVSGEAVYGEDTDFWERAGKKFNIQTIKEPQTYVYSRAENSVTKYLIQQQA
jgi:glycosyltransferase involved in cell wall biosynthesis